MINKDIGDINPEIQSNAISVYSNDSAEEFPVLKAFQQYIDAEQAKARKRLALVATFFTIIILAVIAVFLKLLISAGDRNQSLNDRLVEYAMKERATDIEHQMAVVKLSAKVDEMHTKVSEAEHKAQAAENASAQALKDKESAEKAAAQQVKAAEDKARNKVAEAVRIAKERIQAADEKAREAKALLDAQNAKHQAEEEKRRKKEAELEAYRRKYYPEYYQKQKPEPKASAPAAVKPTARPKTVAKPVAKPVAEPIPEDSDIDDEEETNFDDIDYSALNKKPVVTAVPEKRSAPKPVVMEKTETPLSEESPSLDWDIPND